MKEAGAYDQLSLYNAVFMLLYDQRASMVQVNVEQQEVVDMLDDVHESANSLTVQKEQSQKLQQEIVDNYDAYKQAVLRAYANVEERQ